MADKSPGILETLGMASGAVAFGTVGYEFYNNYQNISESSSLLDNAGKAVKPSSVVKAVRTLEDAGLKNVAVPFRAPAPTTIGNAGGMRTNEETVSLLREFLENTGQYGSGANFEHNSFLNEVLNFTDNITGTKQQSSLKYEFKIRHKPGENYAVDVVVAGSGTKPKTFGLDTLTKGGRYPSTTYGVSYRIPRKFINQTVYNKVMTNQPFDMKQLGMSYNAWIAQQQAVSFNAGISPKHVLSTAKQYLISSPVPTFENPVARLDANLILPIFRDENNHLYMQNTIEHSEEIGTFWSKLNEQTGGEFSKTMGLLNAKQQANGIVIDPAFYGQFMEDFGDGSLTGSRHIKQMFKETMVPAEYAPKTFNIPFAKNTDGVKVGNLINIPTIYDDAAYWQRFKDGDTRGLMDTILNSGIVTGVKEAGVSGHEGAIISSKMAKMPITDFHTMNIDIAGDLNKTGIEELIDEVFRLNYNTSNLYTAATLNSNRPESVMISKSLENLRNSLMSAPQVHNARQLFNTEHFTEEEFAEKLQNFTPEQNKEYRNIREGFINEFTTPQSGGKTKIKDFLHSINGMRNNKDIGFTDYGSKKLNKYGNERIFDIIGGGERHGFRLETRSTNLFGKNAKLWGTGKLTAAKQSRHMSGLAEAFWSMQMHILSGKTFEEQKAIKKQVFGYFDTGNKKAINHIVKQYGSLMPKEIRDLSDRMMITSEPIRKYDPQLTHMDLKELYQQVGIQGPVIPKNANIKQKIKAHKDFYNEKLKSATSIEEKAKLQMLFGPYLGDETGVIAPGFRMGSIHSVGTPLSMSGIGNKSMVSLNVDMAHKFKQYGMPSLHDRIVGNFNKQEYVDLFRAYEPMLANELPKHAAVLEANQVAPEMIDKLFGDIRTDADIKNVRELASEIYTTYNPTKTVSDTTRFYIKLSEDTTIPMLDMKVSSYVGIANPLGEQQGQQAISKLLTGQSRHAVRVARGDIAFDTLESAADDLRTSAVKILSDTSIFTKQPVKGMVLNNLPTEVFNHDLLNKWKEAAASNGYTDKLNAAFQKAGIGDMERINKTRIMGMSTADFENFLTNSDEYDSALDKALSADKALDVNKFKADYIVSQRGKKQLSYGGRPPGGYGAGEVIDTESLLKDIYELQGIPAEEAAMHASDKIISGNVYANMFANAQHQSDNDRDPISIVRTNGKQEYKEIEDYLSKTGTFAMDKFPKGGIKAEFSSAKTYQDVEKIIQERLMSGENSAAFQELRSSMASTFSVGQLSNKMLDLKGFSANQSDDAIFLADVMKEQSIGSKGPLGQDISITQDFFDTVFNPSASLNYKERAAKFKNIVLKTKSLVMDDGEHYFQGKYGERLDDFLATLLRGYDTYASTGAGQVEHFQRRLKYMETISQSVGRNFINATREAQPSENLAVDLLTDTARGSLGKTRKTIIGFQNTMESVGSKILKNKIVQAAAAVGVASYLLRSPDSAVRNQDVREQSVPKKKNLAGAEAIDPNVGSVYKAAPAGYNFQVRGKMPRNTDASQMSHQMGMLGIPISGSIVNRNPAVDASYVNQIHDDNNSLLWNYK